MGTWRRHKGGSLPVARVVESICAYGLRAVRSIPARMRCRADSGQGGDSRAGFGHCGIAGRVLDMGEIVGRHFTILNALSVRMSPDNDSNVQTSPDSARRVRIPPDNARRVRMSPGIARPSRGAQRARKKFPLPYSVNGRKRRSARVAMRRARGILSHKSLDELSPNHIEHL